MSVPHVSVTPQHPATAAVQASANPSARVICGTLHGRRGYECTDGFSSLSPAVSSRARWQSRAHRAAQRRSRRPRRACRNDPIKKMVDRLDLEKYKATIKGLTQFGDRRQGTDRNRAAVDWIEAQLKSYGCTNTERIKYDYQPPAADAERRRRPARAKEPPPGAAAQEVAAPAASAARTRRIAAPWRTASRGIRDAHRRQHRSEPAARREAPRAELAADDAGTARRGLLHEGRHDASRRDVHRRRATWTGTAGARRRTTTARARRW